MLMADGSERTVHVTRVTPTTVEFTYPEETVQNIEDVANIRSITFASGRVQQFAAAAAPTTTNPVSLPPAQPNTLAVLPVLFIDKMSGQFMEDNAKLAQSRIHSFLDGDIKKIAPLKLADLREINSNLRRQNLPFSAVDEIPVEELEQITGAEYLLITKVAMETGSNITSNQTTWEGNSGNRRNNSNTTVTTGSTTQSNQYFYTVVVEIYKGKNKIYSESRRPLLNTADSWRDAVVYLLKRTPIYHR